MLGWPTGVVVSDPVVRPETSVYGTHYDFMGVGGWISVQTLADMYRIPNDATRINPDLISSGQRKLGMVIKVTNLNTYYEFDITGYNDLNDAAKLISFADNNNFKVKNFGGGNAGNPNYQDVIGLNDELNKKVDKISVTDVLINDSLKVASAKALFDNVKYTNSSTYATVGGLPSGSVLNNKTLKEVFDLIFAAPFMGGSSIIGVTVNNQDPGFSGVTREIGNGDLAATVSWTVTKKSNAITSIAVDGTTVILTNGMTIPGLPDATQSGTVNRNIGANGTGIQSYSIAVRDSANTDLGSTSNAINWFHRRYYGTSATTPVALKAGLADRSIQIYGLSGFTSQLSSSRALNNNYNCTGGRFIYYLYPKNGGVNIFPSKGYDQVTAGVKNGVNDFSAYTCENVSIQDRFGFARDYYIFYTGFQTGSSVNINVP